MVRYPIIMANNLVSFTTEIGVYCCEASDLQWTLIPAEFIYDHRHFVFDYRDYENDDVAGWWYRSRSDNRRFLLIND